MPDLPTLLPANASAPERALEQATARIGDVLVPVGDLWSPDNCPAPLLAWLAWAFSVDEWDTAWTEATKRAVIAESVQVHLSKGSVASVRRALTAIGFTDYTLTEWWQPAPELGAAFHTGEPHTYSLGINPLAPGPTFDPELFESVLRALAYTAPVRSHLALWVGIASEGELGIAGALQGASRKQQAAAFKREPGSYAELGIAGAMQGATHTHSDANMWSVLPPWLRVPVDSDELEPATWVRSSVDSDELEPATWVRSSVDSDELEIPPYERTSVDADELES